MRSRINLLVAILGFAFLLFAPVADAEAGPAVVTDLKITTLSTMLTEFQGVGEWGFAALVEVDGKTILFDTGWRPDTVLQNTAELGIDLSAVDTVILSHNHADHTGGLVTLRQSLKGKNMSALQTAHVGKGIFLPRKSRSMEAIPAPIRPYWVDVLDVRDEYEALGGRIVVHSEPHELVPGVWITGPIPRRHPEKNWSPIAMLEQDGELVEDPIPEDQALVINTAEGLIVLAGCGHAGIVNTMEYARSIADNKPIYAVYGGLHLMGLTDQKLIWTGTKMHEFGVQHLLGAHCTGIHPVELLRDAAGLGRDTSVVGAVGTVFTIEDGIRRGRLNR